MRTKSNVPPKIMVGIRLKSKTLKKVDKMAESKEETRTEFLRKLIESVVEAM